tara:strand:+ start:415 stop:543 length:129 start_codon:yes stop_codon:yes gene_type:complete
MALLLLYINPKLPKIKIPHIRGFKGISLLKGVGGWVVVASVV